MCNSTCLLGTNHVLLTCMSLHDRLSPVQIIYEAFECAQIQINTRTRASLHVVPNVAMERRKKKKIILKLLHLHIQGDLIINGHQVIASLFFNLQHFLPYSCRVWYCFNLFRIFSPPF